LSFIANFPESLPVKVFWKSVRNWPSNQPSFYCTQCRPVLCLHVWRSRT